MLEIKESTYLIDDQKVTIDKSINDNNLDLNVEKSKNGLVFFSIKKIKGLFMFDLSGRIIKIGDKINDNKYTLVNNYVVTHGMPLFVKIVHEDGYVYRRI